MSIPQAAFGAVVAAALVFTPGAASHAGPVTEFKLTADAYLNDARLCRDAAVDAVFDAAGVLAAHIKQI